MQRVLLADPRDQKSQAELKLVVVEPHHPLEIIELAQRRELRRIEVMEFLSHRLVDRL